MKYPIIATVTAMLTLFFAALGQNAKPADPPAADVTKPAKLTEPEKKPVPDASKDALRVAIHQHDQAEKQIADINLSFLQVQAQAKQQMDAAQAKEKESAAAITRATEQAYKAAGLEVKDWSLDQEAMQFTQRPNPQAKVAPASPAPAHQ